MKLIIGTLITAIALMTLPIGCKESVRTEIVLTGDKGQQVYVDTRYVRDPDVVSKGGVTEFYHVNMEQIEDVSVEGYREKNLILGTGDRHVAFYESFEEPSHGYDNTWASYDGVVWVNDNYAESRKEFLKGYYKAQFYYGIFLAFLISAWILLLAYYFANWLTKKEKVSFNKWSDYDLNSN
jgi:hypothetical protein